MCPTLSWKVTVVGDGAVGKTTLILRYTEKRFREAYIQTMGVQFTVKETEHEGDSIKLILWDIAGQEDFRGMRKNFYEGSSAAILCFDLTNLISFDHVENWYREVSFYCGNIPFVLIGNKSDLVSERTVTPEMVRSFTAREKIPYFETSAKTGEGVNDMFQALIRLTRTAESAIEYEEKDRELPLEAPIDLNEALEQLEQMIEHNERADLVNSKIRAITGELFKKNPYHERLEEITRMRLEKIVMYAPGATLSPSDKEHILSKIQEWKTAL